MQSAGQFGPGIWFAVFVVIIIGGGLGSYMKWVYLPQKAKDNELAEKRQVAEIANAERLTEVVEKLTVLVGRTDERTTETHEHVSDMRAVLNAVVMAKEYEAEAIAKLAEKLKVDLSRELAGISSVLKFSRAEYKMAAPDDHTH